MRKFWRNLEKRETWTTKGAMILVFPGVSYRTLARRRALRPLPRRLIEAGITYRWEYTFYLAVRHNGRMVTLRSSADLGPLCRSLVRAEDVSVEFWPYLEISTWLPLHQIQQWKKVPSQIGPCRQQASRPPYDG